jgi:predicted ferric reductase
MQGIIPLLFIFLYFIISCAPVFFTFFDQPPPPKHFGIEYTAAIGYFALSLMILQFATTERIRFIEKQFGFDLILQFHKKIGIAILVFALAHPIILFFANPKLLSILNPSTMPLRTVFALISLFSILLLTAMSIFRKKWKISYETWRVTHGLLAISALGFGLLHAIKIDRYLNLFWKGFIWDVFALYVALHLIHARIIRPLLILKKPWEIIKIKEEKGNAWTVTLRAISHKGICFQAGQYAYLRLKTSLIWFDEHPFTISSSATHPSEISFTIKEMGDFSNKISSIPLGTKAYVDGPYGIFSYKNFPSSESIWMLAGGIGITPMLSMLRTMYDENDKRKVHLFFGSSMESHLTGFEEIEQLKQHLNLTTTYAVENPPTEHPDFEQGYITKELLARTLQNELKHPQCFICGPPQFLSQMRKSLLALKIPYKNIHAELFQLV